MIIVSILTVCTYNVMVNVVQRIDTNTRKQTGVTSPPARRQPAPAKRVPALQTGAPRAAVNVQSGSWLAGSPAGAAHAWVRAQLKVLLNNYVIQSMTLYKLTY